MYSAWSFFTAEKLQGFLPCVRRTRTLPFSIWNKVSRSTAGAGSSSMSKTWTRSGDASTSWDSSLKSRRMLHGASGISTCSTRTDMSCRLRARCGQRHEQWRTAESHSSRTSIRKSLRRVPKAWGDSFRGNHFFIPLCNLTRLAAWEERNNFPRYASSTPFVFDARNLPSNCVTTSAAGVGEVLCTSASAVQNKTPTKHIQRPAFDFTTPPDDSLQSVPSPLSVVDRDRTMQLRPYLIAYLKHFRREGSLFARCQIL